MRRHGRLTVLAVLALAVACQRDTERAEDPRAADTSRPPSTAADACAPNGRVPAVTSAGIGVARIGGSLREVGQSCQTRDTTFTLAMIVVP